MVSGGSYLGVCASIRSVLCNRCRECVILFGILVGICVRYDTWLAGDVKTLLSNDLGRMKDKAMAVGSAVARGHEGRHERRNIVARVWGPTKVHGRRERR